MDNQNVFNNASALRAIDNLFQNATDQNELFVNDIYASTTMYYNSSKGSDHDYDYWEYFDLILKERIPLTLKLAFEYSHRIVTFIIWLLAMFGNILILCIMSRRKNRKLPTTAFFISLAVADLTVSLDSLNRGLVFNGLEVFAVSSTGCKVETVFVGLMSSCRVASSWTLVFMTVERLLSVCIPHKVKIFVTLKSAKMIVISLWTFSLTIGFLNVYLTGTVYFDPERIFCFVRDNSFSAFYSAFYIWFVFSMEVVIPWFSLLLMSITIIIFLLKRRHKVSTNDRTTYVTVIILTAIFVFLITQFSYSFFMLYSSVAYKVENLRTYLYYTFFDNTLLVYKDLNCALNFYIYFLAGSRFRTESKLLFTSCYHNFKNFLNSKNCTNTPTSALGT